ARRRVTHGNHAKISCCLTSRCSEPRPIVALAGGRTFSPRFRSLLCPDVWVQASGDALVPADFVYSGRRIGTGFGPPTSDLDTSNCIAGLGPVVRRGVVFHFVDEPAAGIQGDCPG